MLALHIPKCKQGRSVGLLDLYVVVLLLAQPQATRRVAEEDAGEQGHREEKMEPNSTSMKKMYVSPRSAARKMRSEATSMQCMPAMAASAT